MCALASKPLIAILLTTLLSRVLDMVAAGESRPLIDPDTPIEAHTKLGQDGNRYDLVFSDEFEIEGREFGPGMDPYWEAADMHYYATNDLEYYHPDQVTTKEGSLVITLEKTDPATNSYGLSYKSGMLTGWNKLCFSGGILEASVSLPGSPEISGLWPGFWTLGNLARPSYGASTDGMWPYTYDTCDTGTLPNQAEVGGKPPMMEGPDGTEVQLSGLPGQRTSACTCPGEDHPGPRTDVGRSAPELDVFEALVNEKGHFGEVSQSFQLAPFDADLQWNNNTAYFFTTDKYETHINEAKGGQYQQCISGLSRTDQVSYEKKNGGFQTYGVEYRQSTGKDTDGYIYWTQGGETTLHLDEAALGPNGKSKVGQRLVPREPMYVILNLGMSESFGKISEDLTFPTKMSVDYVRIPKGSKPDCSPADFPTTQYIENHMEAYTNSALKR